MTLAARARLELARRPWIRWGAVVALAAATWWSVAGALAGVDRARAAWGEPVDVLVATSDVTPGDRLIDAVRHRSVPAAVAPADAVHRVGTDALARQHVAAGEIVTVHDIAPRTGATALAPDGTLVLTIAEQLPTAAAVGDRVALAADGTMLVDDAVVTGRVDGALLVAVPVDRAATVASAAASAGGVTVLLVP